jgi:hypothetical protein
MPVWLLAVFIAIESTLAVYFLRVKKYGWATISVVFVITFIVQAMTFAQLNVIKSNDEMSLKAPEPREVNGVWVEWHRSDRTCQAGWKCTPCYLPEPDRIPQADGTVSFLETYGCTPDTYRANGHESLQDIADRYTDGNVDLICSEEKWREHPKEWLPKDTLVAQC